MESDVVTDLGLQALAPEKTSAELAVKRGAMIHNHEQTFLALYVSENFGCLLVL